MPFTCRGQVFFAEGQPVGRRSALAQKLWRQGCVSHALSAFSLSSQKGMGNGLSWHRAGEVSLPGSGQALFDGGLPGLAYPHPHPCLWRAGMIGVPRRHLPGVQAWRSLCRHSPRLCSLSSILASRAVHGQDRTARRRLPSLRVALRVSPPGPEASMLGFSCAGMAGLHDEGGRRCPEGWRGCVLPVPSCGMYPGNVIVC